MNHLEEVKEDLQKYTALIHLSMNECGIKSLDNFPKLPKLQIVRIILIFILKIVRIINKRNKWKRF